MRRRRLFIVLPLAGGVVLGALLLALNGSFDSDASAEGGANPPLVPGVSVSVQAEGITAKLEPAQQSKKAPLAPPENFLDAAWQVTITGQPLDQSIFRIIALQEGRETLLGMHGPGKGLSKVNLSIWRTTMGFPASLTGTLKVILEVEVQGVRTRSPQAIEVQVARHQGKLTASGWRVVPAP